LQDDVFIFSKSAKTKKILKSGNVMSSFLKKENDIPDEYLSLAMAIIGDPGDDVTGVKGIGPSGFINIFQELVHMTGNLEQIYNKVHSNESLFNFIPKSIINKKLEVVVNDETKNKTISNNLRLVSFELISRTLDDPPSTEMRDKRLIIEKHFSDEKTVSPLETMKKALEMGGVFLEESSIDFLYI
jgi:5'-3' exonuclease